MSWAQLPELAQCEIITETSDCFSDRHFVAAANTSFLIYSISYDSCAFPSVGSEYRSKRTGISYTISSSSSLKENPFHDRAFNGVIANLNTIS